jgi:hypothetical protein
MEPDTAILEVQDRIKHWEVERKRLKLLEYLARVNHDRAKKALEKSGETLEELYRQLDEHLSHAWLYSQLDCGLLVILRQTPSGMLACRRYGEPYSDEMRFKFNRQSQKFIGKQPDGTCELRAVPQEYIDRALEAADKAKQS